MTVEKPRRRLAISVRVFLLIVLLIGLWIGWMVNKAHQQRRAIDAIREYGGFVHFSHQLVRQPAGHLTPDPTLEPAGPTWLRTLIGDDYFQRVGWVSLVYDDSGGTRVETARTDDSILEHLENFDGLRVLLLHDGQATDEGLAHMRGLTNLESILMWDAHDLTDAGVAHLVGLRNLRKLHISNAKITDASLRHLASLPRIEELSLQGNRFTDAGLAHLRDVTTLRRLHVGLGHDEITDRGIAHLKGLKNLEVLDIQGTHVTDRGLEHLEGLPKMKELWISDQAEITPEGIARLKQHHPTLIVR